MSNLSDAVAARFEQSLLSGIVELTDGFGMCREVTERTLSDMFFGGLDAGYRYSPSKIMIVAVLCELIEHLPENNDIAEALASEYRYDERRNGTRRASETVAESFLSRGRIRTVRSRVSASISFSRWLSFVSQNPRYPFARKYSEVIDTVSRYDLRSYAPPETCRRFVVSVGPTNSGKTHSGMIELSQANSGVYLGPLRLLAWEAADTLEEMGASCSLLTGEERRDREGARHVASTVEMLDQSIHYDVAVIDECQMITDPERGYAWAAAIASVNADIVHLCVAPEALDLICRVLDGLDEDYEVEWHDRLVPLENMGRPVRYPNGIKTGDAIIVFSRKSVQYYVSDLARHGIKASMVYGALPYEVRKEEVRKFADGETDVVVATDAIGMGLNLPVRRVLFAETEKYDGKTTRDLLDPEVKQIAGRAGRFGLFDCGYAGVLSGVNGRLVSNALRSDYESRDEIRVDMPRRLVENNSAPLSYLMRAWQMTPVDRPYVKRNLAQQIALARRVEDLPNAFVMDAVEIPFKSGDKFVPLDDIWEKCVRNAWEGNELKIELYPISLDDTLEHLEDAAKLSDLFYGLAKRYGTKDDLDMIDAHRKLVSEYMIAVLRRRNSTEEMCSWCGKPLDGESKYSMHESCYKEYREDKCRKWDERYWAAYDGDDNDDSEEWRLAG